MKNLVMSVRTGEWNIDEEFITVEKLETINLGNQIKADNIKGLIPVTWNLKDSPINESYFSALPGIYEVVTKHAHNPKVKGRIVVPCQAQLIKALEFPRRNDNAVLVLGVRETKKGPNSKKSDWFGVSVWYADTSMEGQNNDNVTSRGIPIIQESIQGMTLQTFRKCPAWYHVKTVSTRGTNGIDIEKIIDFAFAEDFNPTDTIISEMKSQEDSNEEE